MAINIGAGSAWKALSKMSVGVGGVWKDVTAMWVGVGGVWKQVQAFISAVVNAATYSGNTIFPANASASIEFRSTGYMYRSLNGGAYTLQYQWLTSDNVGADYDIRLTPTGDTLTGSSTGAWLNLGTARIWTLSNTTAGLKTTSCVVEIRDATTLIVLASATIVLEAYVEAT